MAKSPYMPADDGGKNNRLQNFASKLPGYAAQVGVAPAEVTSVQNDAKFFDYVLNGQQQFGQFAQDWTAYKNAARNGNDPAMGAIPVAPVLPTAPAVVAPGIFPRMARVVARIKNHPSYTEAMGKDLGIIGADQNAPDLSEMQPQIGASINGNKVEVGWDWGGCGAWLDSCEIQVDRADGKGFVFLTNDTTPGYNDTMPFPATPTKWTYRAIYRVSDAQVGRWSNPVSLIVPGQ